MEGGIFKNKAVKIMLCLLAVIICFGAVMTVLSVRAGAESVGELEAQAAALAEKVKANEQKIKDLENTINKLKAQASSTLEYKEELQKQVQFIQDNIDEQDELIKNYEDMIKAKSNDVAVLNTDLNERYGIFLDKMRSSYENGDHGYLEMLLECDSLIDFITRIEKIGSLLTYEKKLIDSIDTEAETLQEAKGVLTEEKKAAEEIKSAQKKNKADLNAKVTELNKLMKEIERDESKAEQERKKAVAENNKANEEIEKILKEIAKQNASQYVGGTYIWPLDATYNKITSLARTRTLFGVVETHRGDDISAPTGANIYAANDGTVVVANDWTVNYSSYGNYILIDHGGGQATLYAHCSRLLVRQGQTVKQGDLIGLVGATGRVTGSHLHFEIRDNGNFTEPFTPGVLKMNVGGNWVDPTEKDANGKYKYIYAFWD